MAEGHRFLQVAAHEAPEAVEHLTLHDLRLREPAQEAAGLQQAWRTSFWKRYQRCASEIKDKSKHIEIHIGLKWDIYVDVI